MEAKINLSTGEVIEFPSQFPILGVLREKVSGGVRLRDNAAEIKANPQAWLQPHTVQVFDYEEKILDEDGVETGESILHYRDKLLDPCPPELKGFGWLPVTEVKPALAIGETYGGGPTLTVDTEDMTVTATYAVVSDPTAIAAAFDGLEAELIREVKRAAGAVILAEYPDWKQRNMTAEAASLTRIRAIGGSWTQAQSDRADALDAAWAWVSAVRAASDAAEAAITAAKGDEAAMRAAATVDWEAI